MKTCNYNPSLQCRFLFLQWADLKTLVLVWPWMVEFNNHVGFDLDSVVSKIIKPKQWLSSIVSNEANNCMQGLCIATFHLQKIIWSTCMLLYMYINVWIPLQVGHSRKDSSVECQASGFSFLNGTREQGKQPLSEFCFPE